MRADAHGIGRARKKIGEACDDDVGQRRDCVSPRVLPQRAQFRGELQQPSPAIGTFIPPGRRFREIGAFTGDFFWRQLLVEQSFDIVGYVGSRKASQYSREQPVAVDAGMPVEAAVKHRVQGGWRPGVGVGAQHMSGLVGVFAPHMAKGDAREAARQLFGEWRCGHDHRSPTGNDVAAGS